MGCHKPGKWLGLLASEWTLGAMTHTLQCRGQTLTTKSYRPHLSGLRNPELVQTPHLQESRHYLHRPRPEADNGVPPSEAHPPSYLCEPAHKTPVPQSQSFCVQSRFASVPCLPWNTYKNHFPFLLDFASFRSTLQAGL